ncbi:MAG: hypothetical protein ACI9BH_001682 [Paracoccaceae bacterium]|jgi:hypothetical protein
MATKAQLMVELDLLKQQMASRDDTSARKAATEQPKIEAETDDKTDPKSFLSTLLASHGIDETEIDALWAQLSGELGDLTREKPLLTVVAAFGIGFVTGRLSK